MLKIQMKHYKPLILDFRIIILKLNLNIVNTEKIEIQTIELLEKQEENEALVVTNVDKKVICREIVRTRNNNVVPQEVMIEMIPKEVVRASNADKKDILQEIALMKINNVVLKEVMKEMTPKEAVRASNVDKKDIFLEIVQMSIKIKTVTVVKEIVMNQIIVKDQDAIKVMRDRQTKVVIKDVIIVQTEVTIRENSLRKEVDTIKILDQDKMENNHNIKEDLKLMNLVNALFCPID